MAKYFKNPDRNIPKPVVSTGYIPEHVKMGVKPEVQSFGAKQDMSEGFKKQHRNNAQNTQPNVGKTDMFAQYYDEPVSKVQAPELEDLNPQELQGKKPLMVIEEEDEVPEPNPVPEETNMESEPVTEREPDWLLPGSVFNPENKYLILISVNQSFCTIYATAKTEQEACALIEEECLSGQNGLDVENFLVFKSMTPGVGVYVKD